MNEISLAVIDGRITTTSQQIAQNFGKRHDNVMRKIRNLECSPEFNALNFEAAEYFDEKGELRPSYRITRDGFTFLAMGFTGKEAAQWKEHYIGAFNAMEAELRAKDAPKVGAGGTALPAPKDKLSKALRAHINKTAHATALHLYDGTHKLLTDCALDNLACGASQAEAMQYVEALASYAEGVTIINVRDAQEMVWAVSDVLNAAGKACAAIQRIEQRTGLKLYHRPTTRYPADFHKHDSLVHEVISRMVGDTES